MMIVWCGAFPAAQGELIEGIGEGIGEALVGGNHRPYGGDYS